jgi:hypothetical protein
MHRSVVDHFPKENVRTPATSTFDRRLVDGDKAHANWEK